MTASWDDRDDDRERPSWREIDQRRDRGGHREPKKPRPPKKQAEMVRLLALKQAEAALEVAVKQQQVDLKEAETQVLVNKKLAEGVNDAFVTQRALRSLQALAENENTVFFLPMEALKNPAMLLGAMGERH